MEGHHVRWLPLQCVWWQIRGSEGSAEDMKSLHFSILLIHKVILSVFAPSLAANKT
jgi:hypothetical protein